jgi:hypothetical protein
MPDFKHVGTVEILRDRLYKIDPYNRSDMATEAVVEAGIYPLYSDDFSYLWLMSGLLNGQFLRRGDGLFLATPDVNAVPLNITVSFPSKLFGPSDWEELLAHPSTQEGHPDQRLRITILEDAA